MIAENAPYMDSANSGDDQQVEGDSAVVASDPGPMAVINHVTKAMRSIPPVIGELEPLGEDVPTYGSPAASPLENKEQYRAISVTVPRAGKITKQIVTTTRWTTIRSILNEFEALAKAEGFDMVVAADESDLLYHVTLVKQAGQSGTGPMSREHQDFINLFPYSFIAR